MIWLIGSKHSTHVVGWFHIYLITLKHLYKNCDCWGTTNNEWLSAKKIARRLRHYPFVTRGIEKTDDSDAAIAVIYDTDALFSSWSKSICNPEMGIPSIWGSMKTTASF